MRTICCDRDGENIVFFSCPTSGCEDRQCADCHWEALSIGTRKKGSKCPACNTKAKAVCQIIARNGKAVADTPQLLDRHRKCAALKEVTAEAKKVYNKIADEILLKCSHCKLTRGVYDGNIALACDCGAAFCAICVIECADIHHHVRNHHGGRLKNDMNGESGTTRIKEIVQSHLRRIAKKSDELTQLVNNQFQNAGHFHDRITAHTSSRLTKQFLVDAKSELFKSTRPRTRAVESIDDMPAPLHSARIQVDINGQR